MQITISLDPNEFSEQDRATLRAIAESGVSTPEKSVSQAKAAQTPTAKATPAPKAEKASKTAPEPEAEDEVTEDDTAAPTMEDAISLATKLVSNGQASKVKAALADAGAKRVSELKDSDVADFVAALS